MNKEVIGGASLYLGDCMEYMATLEDNCFDLAIVDPPYGIKAHGTIGFANEKTKGFTFTKKEYSQKDWDNKIPDKDYFEDLKRVSKNQIIWGANYMTESIGVIKNFIYWHKKGKSQDDKFNEGELAYVSFSRSRMVDIWWNGFGTINSGEQRIHPTQKPVALYQWLLNNYAKPGQTILDTHLGSGSSAIAANRLDFEFVGIEIDEDYFAGACKRLREENKQLNLFKPETFEQINFDLDS